MPALRNLISVLEDFAPVELAESWDNVGLQIGDPDHDVDKVLVSLDASFDAAEEAIANNCQLLLTHHPLLFDAPKNVVAGSVLYNTLKVAFENDLSIYSAHTNLDKAQNGLNRALADFFELTDARPAIEDTVFVKLVFFVEPQHSVPIIEALSEAGAGIIGKYSTTSFRAPGTGTFKPEKGARPAVGDLGVLNQVKEERVEVLVHKAVLPQVIARLLKEHPYEEVAYDVYPLNSVKKSQLGLGSIGALERTKPIKEIAVLFEKKTKSKVKFVGDPAQKVANVAIIAGSAASYIDSIAGKGVELLITADVKYHEAQRAQNLGLNLIVASHYAMEKLALDLVVPLISAAFDKEGYSVDVMSSKKESDVWIEN